MTKTRPDQPCQSSGDVVVRQDLVKEKDLIIYQDDRFYSAFPSVVVREDGDILVAFRRAPSYRAMGLVGEPDHSHTDPNSYLVLVRSTDNGNTWTTEPELIFAHPFGGSQDPCLTLLRDGTIVCSSYGWTLLQRDEHKFKWNSPKTPHEIWGHFDYAFLGGYLLRSADGGHSWDGPILPPPVSGSKDVTVFMEPCPAYNRGPMWEGQDGTLYWAVVAKVGVEPLLTEVHLLASHDGGLTWEYRCPVARDTKVSFNETALIETRSGTLLAFLRTAGGDFDLSGAGLHYDQTAVARSTDGGRSFGPWEDAGFRGHPHCATLLPDGRILLVYGYRHQPFGVRARILDAEATNLSQSEEIVLRDEGGNVDLGYPWVSRMADGRYLVVYYFHRDNGTRYIAGTILSLKS